MSVIKPTDLTSSHVSSECTQDLPPTPSQALFCSSINICSRKDDPNVCIVNAKQLYDLFLQRSDNLVSDGTVVECGTIKVVTTSCASLKSHDVIQALKEHDARNAVKRKQRCVLQAQMEERTAQRVIVQSKGQDKRERAKQKADEKEESELQQLRVRRESRRQRLAETREPRRKRAENITIHRLLIDE